MFCLIHLVCFSFSFSSDAIILCLSVHLFASVLWQGGGTVVLGIVEWLFRRQRGESYHSEFNVYYGAHLPQG